MYCITNTESHERRGFESRDQLLRFLEEQDAYCKGENLTLEMKLLQMDHDTGEILDNLIISLPLQRPADNLLLDFGKKKETKKSLLNPFMRKGKDSAPREIPEEGEAVPASQAVLDVPPPSIPAKRVQTKPELGHSVREKAKNFVLLMLMLSLLGMTGLSVLQYLSLQHLTKEVKVLEIKANQERQLDIFGRYFLSYYYSGNNQADMTSFVAEEVKSSVVPQQAGLASALLESVEFAGDETYQLTYILTVKEGETVRQERMNLVVKSAPSSSHGYLLIVSPQATPYPITRK